MEGGILVKTIENELGVINIYEPVKKSTPEDIENFYDFLAKLIVEDYTKTECNKTLEEIKNTLETQK